MKLPKSPGCYLFKDKEDNILYVGKAKDIRNRVSNYFHNTKLDAKTKALVKNISETDFITTDNEVEALLLEDALIKKHKPKYNIRLRDAKSYAYIILTDEKFPRIAISREDKGIEHFGPFVSGEERDYVYEAVSKIFRLRTCKKLKKRPCLRYQMKICSAPCAGYIDVEEYRENLKAAKEVLKGNISKAKKELEKQMHKFSKNKMFEKAMQKRDQIHALENLDTRQKVVRDRKFNEDIMNFVICDNRVYLMVFNIYKGTLTNKKEFVFDEIDGWFDDFLIQYYRENKIPKEIVIPQNIDKSLHEYLEKKKGQKVIITIPKIAAKKKLLELIQKNIELQYFGGLKKIEALAQAIDIEKPHVIEAFDISHLGGKMTTASMVQFREGKPDKSNYRRFKISTERNDDYEAMREVVHRRYRRLRNEKRKYPDLILIDGGKGQLKAACRALQELETSIPIISFAKQNKEIYLPGKTTPILLEDKNNALLFIEEIISEAHRFAIKYNKLLRTKR